MSKREYKTSARSNDLSADEIKHLIYKIIFDKYGVTKSILSSKEITSESPNSIKELNLPLIDANMSVNAPKSNLVKVFKILSDLSDENSSISYAPLIYPIISFLVTYLPVNEAKACANLIINDNSLMPTSKVEWNKFCQSFQFVWQQYSKKSFRHFSGHKEASYYWPYLIWRLPELYQHRIILCYLIEGIKVLYRASVVLYKETYEQNKATGHYNSNLRELTAKTVQEIGRKYSVVQFLNCLFKIRNFKRKKIEKSQQKTDSFVSPGIWINPTSSKLYVAFQQMDTNPSKIVTTEELINILKNVPPTLRQTYKPQPLFYSGKDGYSIRSLFNKSEEIDNSILLIETAKGEIIGGFTSTEWGVRNRKNTNLFYGKGDCFVFRVRPTPFTVYRWVGDLENNAKLDSNETGDNSVLTRLFQKANDSGLELGGSKKGSAIRIDKDLNKGWSCPSETFGNPCLTCYSNEEFLIKSVELLYFEEV